MGISIDKKNEEERGGTRQETRKTDEQEPLPHN